jgi:hypothetical protein
VFHPFQPPVHAAENASLEAQVLPDGLQIETKGQERRLHFSADSSLDVLEGRTAYLLTKDSRRLLFPMEGDSDPARRIGHSRPKFRLLYADDELVCDLFARPLGKRGETARWEISSAPHGFGLRSLEPTEAAGNLERAASGPPSRRLWLRLQWAAFDGWTQWPGTMARSPLWLDELQLIGAHAVTVSGGYRGGEMVGTAAATINLDGGPQHP